MNLISATPEAQQIEDDEEEEEFPEFQAQMDPPMDVHRQAQEAQEAPDVMDLTEQETDKKDER